MPNPIAVIDQTQICHMAHFQLKFQIDKQAAGDLWARATALGFASGRPKTRTLRSIYLDTPGHALKNAGITLGLERNGRRWTQSVRLNSSMRSGGSQPVALENPAPGGRLCLEAISDTSIR